MGEGIPKASEILQGLSFKRVRDGSESKGIPLTFDIFTGIDSASTLAWDENGTEWEAEGDLEPILTQKGFSLAPPLISDEDPNEAANDN